MIAEQVRARVWSVKLVTQVVLGLIVVANLLVGVALWSSHTQGISERATADLRTHVATLQSLLAANAWSDTVGLSQISAQLDPLSSDLHTLDSVIPFGGALPVGGDSAQHHALAMAEDMALAAKHAIAAELILLPALRGLEATALGAVSGKSVPGAHLLTQDDVSAAQVHLDPAMAAMQDALAEWQSISPNDQAQLERGATGPFLHLMSAVGAKLDGWLQLESAVLDWSPALLGLQEPARLLLVVMDSNVPRPTGGAITHVALLTLNQGAIAPGIHLQPVSQLDCPVGTCPVRPLPSNYQWMPLAPGQYGLGFSNIDPDFTVSAWSIFNAFVAEGGSKVSGIIAITPAALLSALDTVESVTLPAFGVTVTAGNLVPLMHQYDELGENGQHAGTADFTSDLFQALGARLAALDEQQQARLWHELGNDLATKDIQLYAFNQRTEAELASLDLAANIPPIQHGDALYIVDTSLDSAPVGLRVSEQISDTIALDNNQGAQHTLSITYHYAPSPPGTQGVPYDDLVRVIAASGAVQGRIAGPCAAAPAASHAEAFRTVLGCRFRLLPGQSLTLQFSWYAADVLTNTGVPEYSLLVQRQAGQSVSMQIGVSAPDGQSLTQTSASSGTAPTISNGKVLWLAKSLATDTTLTTSVE